MNNRNYYELLKKMQQILSRKNRDMDLEDIKDAMQNAVVEGWIKFKIKLFEDEALDNWLFTAAQHDLMDIRRRRKNELSLDDTEIEQVGNKYSVLDECRMELEEFHVCMKKYPRLFEVLCFIEVGFTATEVAGLLDEKIDTIRKRIQRMRKIAEKWHGS